MADSGLGSLRQAIVQANASGAPHGIVGSGNKIIFDLPIQTTPQTIALNSSLPWIFSQMNIEGPANGVILDGQSAYRGFFVGGLPLTANGAPQNITTSLSNIALHNMLAQGGNGSGGGMGAGGARFINQNANVSLENVNFGSPSGDNGNQAIGGTGSFGPGGGD